MLNIEVWAQMSDPDGSKSRLGAIRCGFADTFDHVTKLLVNPAKSTWISEFTATKVVIESRRRLSVVRGGDLSGVETFIYAFTPVSSSRPDSFNVLRGIAYALSRQATWMLTGQRAMDALDFVEGL